MAGSYKTLTAENNWTLPDNDDWKNLAVTDSNGNPYIYFVKETVPSGYTFVSSTETSSSSTITITNEQKLISLTVEKSWIDNTSNLPDSIYVELWRKTELNPDGKLVSGSGKYLTAENGWKLPSNDIWEHLPVSDKNGNIYTYFVKETVPSGFTFVSTTYLNGEEVYQTSGHEGTITITNRSEDSPELKIRKADADNPEKGLQGARAYNQKLLEYSSIEQAVTEFEKNSEDYEQILNVNGDGIIGILEIPEVDIYLPVYHGTEKEVLRAGAGHYEGSSFPVGGESTHAVITGHRGLPSADLFTRLDEMEEGDTFYFHVFDDTLCYQIDSIEIVEPEEVDSLSIIPGEDKMTLVTCTPYGINSHRLLLHGERIPYTVEQGEVLINPAKKVSQKRMIILGAAATTGLLLLFVTGMAVRKKRRKLQKTGRRME